jgi:phosphoglucosamine mutase
MADPRVNTAVEAASAKLGDAGRVLLRPSGTEPAIRVMVEAAGADVAERVASDLAAVVRQAMAGAGATAEDA